MKKIVIGILAHVDAGKTTLSEAMLYRTGRIRKLGRVDHQDTFLDQDPQEKERGITIFSKQAVFCLPDARTPSTEVTLLDTPGHVDFSSEMERTLPVLDYAILVISGSDGVQSHTRTLWRLLDRYRVPAFIFINKMDLGQRGEKSLMEELQKELSPGCIDFGKEMDKKAEDIASLDEALIDRYLETGEVPESEITRLVQERKLFPCYFGSALKLEGVEKLLEGLDRFSQARSYPEEFGARVYKIGHDTSGERITYMKITGGELKVRDVIRGGEGEEAWEDKVNQIRIYGGGKFNAVDKAGAGSVCAVTGLQHSYPAQGLGEELDADAPLLDSFLTYQVIPEDQTDLHTLHNLIKRLEEEDPLLHVTWNEQYGELNVQLMGEVQLEVLKRMLQDRFGVKIGFGPGNIVYRETITAPVEGVGHYEPLRHYAEVHLLMEPGARGSGIRLESRLRVDELDKPFQHLVLTHLAEKAHLGVLTGSPLTDVRISLVGGAASVKHTVGGDFRQATYRAVRQGLMEAKCQLLEPWYDFELTVPTACCGRALSDLSQMAATFDSPAQEGQFSVIKGYAPVACLQGYALQVTSYTKGEGNLLCIPRAYAPCHNEEEVIQNRGYDPVADLANSPDSIFCAHGAGFSVPWYLVPSYMHLETEYSYLHPGRKKPEETAESPAFTKTEERQEAAKPSSVPAGNAAGSGTKSAGSRRSGGYGGTPAEDKALMAIFEKTYGKVKERDFEKVRKEPKPPKVSSNDEKVVIAEPKHKKEYLLVDGYNVIYSWDSLRKLSEGSMDVARTRLMDLMTEYRSLHNCTVILVFDAYNVPRDTEDIYQYHNIHVVFTRQAETADTYIEKTTRDMDKRYTVRVVSSDGVEQVIVLGHGALRVSSREFEEEVRASHERFQETMEAWNRKEKNRLTQSVRLPDEEA